MKTNNRTLWAIALASLLLLGGCASGTLLPSRAVANLDTGHGTYTLILAGGQNFHDLNAVAILDRSDDPYTILPFGEAFNTRLIPNLSAAEAMERGEAFLANLASYRTTEKREIIGPDHTVIGYELRPLFMPMDTGLLGDIVDTAYVFAAENRVTVYVGYRAGYQDPRDAERSHLPSL